MRGAASRKSRPVGRCSPAYEDHRTLPANGTCPVPGFKVDRMHHFERAGPAGGEQEHRDGRRSGHGGPAGVPVLGEVAEKRVALRSAAELIGKLGHWRDTLDIDGIMVETNVGGMLTEERAAESVRRIAEEVAPALGRRTWIADPDARVRSDAVRLLGKCRQGTTGRAAR